MKKFIFLFILFFGLFDLKGQYTYFNNRFNNDNWSAALSILETESGYVISGVSGVVSNDYIFKRIVLTSIDDQGNQLWWKTYGEDFHNYYAGGIRGCISTSDGGFVISGSIEDSIRDVGLLIKFDENGDSLWSRIYGDSASIDYTATIFTVCEQLPDNGFLITGYVHVSGDDDDILLIRTDNLGNIKWFHTYGQLHWLDAGYSLIPLPEGNFLIGLDRQQVGNNTSRDPGLLKVDSLGNQIWIKYYGGIYDDGHSVVILSQDGNYLVGSTYAVSQPHPDYPDLKVWIFKTDTAGNVIWERKYSDTTFLGWCSTIEELGDGSIIVSGTGAFADGFGNYGWILKTKENGDSIWMRRYSYYPTFENHLNDLRITSDNGIIITGMALGDPEWEQSIWVQKLDSIGCDSSGCDTTVGIHEEHGGMEAWEHGILELWPNPASDWIHIIFRENRPNWLSNRDLEIFNVFGKLVDRVKVPMITESYDFNVSNLPQGLYLLVIRERQKVVYTGKFLIAR
ncbi:MAG: T9SS type A sorting domain-containing protein [Bacteroidales bacterium]|nr:T9SS type A sorting domain-containing protein [Bacteroidales bacterium]